MKSYCQSLRTVLLCVWCFGFAAACPLCQKLKTHKSLRTTALVCFYNLWWKPSCELNSNLCFLTAYPSPCPALSTFLSSLKKDKKVRKPKLTMLNHWQSVSLLSTPTCVLRHVSLSVTQLLRRDCFYYAPSLHPNPSRPINSLKEEL